MTTAEVCPEVVLVFFDRGTGNPVDLRLTQLNADDGPLAVTEPVIMEVLAGARTDSRENDLRRLLLRFDLHSVDPAGDFEAAARIYRNCFASSGPALTHCPAWATVSPLAW